MADFFAGGHLRFLEGEWRNDDGDVVEIVEVRHGEWKKTNNRKKSYMYDCSACGKTAYFCGMICAYDFCPNCGADMRGKKDDM